MKKTSCDLCGKDIKYFIEFKSQHIPTGMISKSTFRIRPIVAERYLEHVEEYCPADICIECLAKNVKENGR